MYNKHHSNKLCYCRSVECRRQPTSCQLLLLRCIHTAVPQCWLIVISINKRRNWQFHKMFIINAFVKSSTSICTMTYSRYVIQQLAVIGCNAATNPQLAEIQTPLIRFVDLIWTCCGFAVESTTNPQCQDVVDLLWTFDLLWICCTACCTANPQRII